MTFHPAKSILILLSMCVGWSAAAVDQTIATEQFAADATRFLQTEITAHLAAVESIDPPQKTVLGVPTAGDFTWGSFMRAITECTALTGETNVAGRNIPQFLGKLGLIEARAGGKTFSQLGAALALRRFGTDLKTNALWQGLSPPEQNEWRALLNPERFYDIKTHRVIKLPENYLGVASRIAIYNYEMGLTPDRAFADDVLTTAAGQFLKGARYTDDNLPTGRYDRYSQEYARFIWEASHNLGRKDVQDAVEPALNAVMPTWWALVDRDGYGYPWGRTIGDMSYLDTMEIIGFLADHPEFRPAPLADLASVYFAAWQSLQRDYQPDRHLLNMFGFGRGSYHYMTVERQWQQTTGFLFKSADSLQRVLAALRAEKISSFPSKPQLPDVARFDFFRKGDRPAGVWLVRRGDFHFALPITTGVRPGIADYLPAPHGLPGFAAPVEQLVPALTPYLELEDGRIIVAGDGADEIEPAKDGKSLRVVWKRWVLVNPDNKPENDLPFGEAEKFVEPGLTTEVGWLLGRDGALYRTETIRAERQVTLRRIWMAFPATGDKVTGVAVGPGSTVGWQFTGREGTIGVKFQSSHGRGFESSLEATGNSPPGKGTRGHIPMILTVTATNVVIGPKTPLKMDLDLRPVDGK